MTAIDKSELLNIGTLAIAQVGDAVFELMVRTRLCVTAPKASSLHKQRIELVNAQAQSRFAKKILPLLLDEEINVFRRGRNTQVSNIPKSSSRADYQYATALETLFGWLHLSGQHARAEQLFDFCMGEDDYHV